MKNHSLLTFCVVAGMAFGSPSNVLSQQGLVVQLPTQGSFSVQTSVLVPDQGSTYLGGTGGLSQGMTQRGPWRAGGSSAMGGGASVRATIIDLDELDRMIRSESSGRAILPPTNLAPNSTTGTPADNSANLKSPSPSTSRPAEMGNYGPPRSRTDRPAAYDYMVSMTHRPNAIKPSVQDAGHFLSLANDARRRGHWAAAQTYYEMAWRSLPEKHQLSAIQQLEDSRKKKVDESPTRSPRKDF
jgi:hypothetical protein